MCASTIRYLVEIGQPELNIVLLCCCSAVVRRGGRRAAAREALRGAVHRALLRPLRAQQHHHAARHARLPALQGNHSGIMAHPTLSR